MQLKIYISYFIDDESMLKLYYANEYSYLSYGLLVWGTMPKEFQILKLQKISGSNLVNVTNHDCKPLPLTKIILLELAKFAYKYE